jgi:hypothetical protein
MEYKIENSMIVHYRYNFLHGAESQLKKQTRRQWVPPDLAEVTPETLETIFKSPEGLRIDLSYLLR